MFFNTIRIIFVVRIVIFYIMKANFTISTVLGTVGLSLLAVAIETGFGRDLTANYIGWLFLSNVLVVTLLGVLLKHNTLAGWKLVLFLFLSYFLIGHFSLLIEAYIFNVSDRRQTIALILQGLVLSLLAAPLLVYLFGKWNGQSTKLSFAQRSFFSWTWRVLLGDLLYVFFYLLAGMILYAVYPKLMDFYGDKVPPFPIMIGTQFYRAVIFMFVAILVNRFTKLSLVQRGLLLGSFFAIVGGISQLILPESELMPDYIRFGHAFEVGISNFIYGLLLSFLLGQRMLSDTRASEQRESVASSIHPI